jgi:hypothetical protein
MEESVMSGFVLLLILLYGIVMALEEDTMPW